MSAGLRELLDGAPLCEAVEADLRRGMLKIAVPALMPIPRGAVLLLAEADVAAALQADESKGEILFEPVSGDGWWSDLCLDGASYSFRRGGAEWTVYFDRPGDGSRIPYTWWGGVERKDVHGKIWRQSLPRMVMDDFGELVEVGR